MQTSSSWTRSGSKNNYLCNSGTELNTTTGWYETLFRGYDAALGRFLQVDPLAADYSDWSPNMYAYNDPVFWNDQTGLEGTLEQFMQELSIVCREERTKPVAQVPYFPIDLGRKLNAASPGSSSKIYEAEL